MLIQKFLYMIVTTFKYNIYVFIACFPWIGYNLASLLFKNYFHTITQPI